MLNSKHDCPRINSKRNVSYTRKTAKLPQQSNLVERKTDPQNGQTKGPAVLMFEKADGKSADLTNELETFNYNRHSLINKNKFNEFNESLSELDANFIKDLYETFGDED